MILTRFSIMFQDSVLGEKKGYCGRGKGLDMQSSDETLAKKLRAEFEVNFFSLEPSHSGP